MGWIWAGWANIVTFEAVFSSFRGQKQNKKRKKVTNEAQKFFFLKKSFFIDKEPSNRETSLRDLSIMTLNECMT